MSGQPLIGIIMGSQSDWETMKATADLLTQRLQLHEKTAWMLHSLLEKN